MFSRVMEAQAGRAAAIWCDCVRPSRKHAPSSATEAPQLEGGGPQVLAPAPASGEPSLGQPSLAHSSRNSSSVTSGSEVARRALVTPSKRQLSALYIPWE